MEGHCVIMNHNGHRPFSYTLKLFTILLGLVLFFCLPVRSVDEHEADLLIPILADKLPDGLMLVGPPFKEF